MKLCGLCDECGGCRRRQMQESEELLSDSLLLLVCEVREHRQRKYPFGETLGNRKVAGLVPQPDVCLLQVEWNRIVNASADSRLGQVLAHSLTIRHLHYIEVVHRLSGVGLVRDQQIVLVPQQLSVTSGRVPPHFSPTLHVLQLYSQNSGLNRIQPA